MRCAFVFAVGLVGCSQQPSTLTIGLPVQASVVAVRGDSRPWTEPPELAHSETSAIYQLSPTDEAIAVACIRADGTFQVEELLAQSDELPDLLYASFLPWPQLDCAPPATGPSVDITGHVLQGAQVYIGDDQFSGSGPWSYAVRVSQGTHDIVATNNAQVLIRHDVTMVAPTVVPDLDLSNDGSSVTSVPLSIVGLDSDAFASVTTILDTVHGTHVVQQNFDDQVTLAPADQLANGDVETVVVEVDDQSGNDVQTATAFVNAGVAPTIFVQPPLAGITFHTDVIAADIANQPSPYSTARLEYATDDGSLAVTATVGWIGAHDPGSLELDESFPEFRWPIAPAAAERTLTLAARTPLLVQTEAVSDP